MYFKVVCQNPRVVKKPEKNERNQTRKISHCAATFKSSNIVQVIECY